MKNVISKLGFAAAAVTIGALVACSSASSGGDDGATVVTGGAAGSGTAGKAGSGTAGAGNKAGAGTAGKGTAGSAPADCGSQASGTDTCSTCIQGSCCAEAKACDTGTPCDAVFTCANACGAMDMACIQKCLQMPGGSDAQAFAGCLGKGGACETDCANAGGGICDSGLTTNNDACDMCIGGACCADVKACKADMACLNCITGKTTTGCDTNALAMKVATCQMGCAASCM